MKNLLTNLLALLMLPLTAAASTAFVATMLAVTAFFSPILIFGGALELAGKLTTKLTDRLYSKDYSQFFKSRLLTGIGSMALLVPICMIPVAVGGVALAAVICPIIIPVLAVDYAKNLATRLVNFVCDVFDLNKYEKLKENTETPGENSETLKENNNNRIPQSYQKIFHDFDIKKDGFLLDNVSVNNAIEDVDEFGDLKSKESSIHPSENTFINNAPNTIPHNNIDDKSKDPKATDDDDETLYYDCISEDSDDDTQYFDPDSDYESTEPQVTIK